MTVHLRSIEHNLWTTAWRSMFDWGGVMAWAAVLLAVFAAILSS